MDCFKWRNISIGIVVICMILIGVGVAVEEIILVYIGFAIAILDSILLFFKWRCPHCNRYLSSKTPFFIEHCPWCGKKL